jgi:lysozyme family protein
MPSEGFQASLPFVLRWEGGFVDHPKDPGGRTNKGVTQRVYDDWRRRQGLPQRDVKAIEEAEVQQIYESGYWIPPRCDLLGRQLDLVQFDTAVNMGPGRAVRLLQAAVGAGIDGDFGSRPRGRSPPATWPRPSSSTATRASATTGVSWPASPTSASSSRAG